MKLRIFTLKYTNIKIHKNTEKSTKCHFLPHPMFICICIERKGKCYFRDFSVLFDF